MGVGDDRLCVRCGKEKGDPNHGAGGEPGQIHPFEYELDDPLVEGGGGDSESAREEGIERRVVDLIAGDNIGEDSRWGYVRLKPGETEAGGGGTGARDLGGVAAWKVDDSVGDPVNSPYPPYRTKKDWRKLSTQDIRKLLHETTTRMLRAAWYGRLGEFYVHSREVTVLARKLGERLQIGQGQWGSEESR